MLMFKRLIDGLRRIKTSVVDDFKAIIEQR